MPYDLIRKFVIGISSRALLDLSRENLIFERDGAEIYERYQRDHQAEPLGKGSAFQLIETMLSLNKHLPSDRSIEVIVLSRNSPASAIRMRRSIEAHGLPICRFVFTSGESVARYLRPLHVDLFLSASAEDVRSAHGAAIAAGLIYGLPQRPQAECLDELRIAFDGDAVLFSEESERVYKEQGLEAFLKHEAARKAEPLSPGPFAKVLRGLSYLQQNLGGEGPRIKLGLVTARNAPADERVLATLDAWKVRVDTLMFLGGVAKAELLLAFDPHIFFDDQVDHCVPAAAHVPTAQVMSSISDQTEPNCPGCGGRMEARVATRGANLGRPFWGCRAFPVCRRTVSMP